MDAAALEAFYARRNLAHQPLRALCYAPLNNLYFDRFGDARVCCWDKNVPLGNVTTHTMDEIWRGPAIDELRRTLIADRFTHGCGFCEFQLAGGVFDGAKLMQFDRFKAESAAPAWPKQIEFSISNACNLECVMCDGNHSSAIRAHREHRPPMPRLYSDAFLDSMRPYLAHLDQAKFLGGEPFLVTEHFRLWEMMIEDRLPATCHVTTNATQYNDKVAGFLDRLTFAFAVSLDAASKQTYEAIRVGANFEEVMANSRRFRDYARERRTSFAFTFCLMRLNWREFGDFCLMADDWEAHVGVNTVRFPPELGLYTLPVDDLRHVLDGMEAQADEMDRRLRLNKPVWFAELERLRARVSGADGAIPVSPTPADIEARRPQAKPCPKNAFVFAVAGERHVQALDQPLRYLKRFSNAEILVVQARSGVRAAHDQVIEVDVADDYTDHEASILLKTDLLAHVGGLAERFCYLDSDVIAVADDVDEVFDLLDGPVRFARDHVDLDRFSRWAVRCGCREDGGCNHLREAMLCSLGVDVRACDWRLWNGGVFVFDARAQAFFAQWRRLALQILDDPYWTTRDQGALAATAWSLGLEHLEPLPQRFNFIVDRMWDVPTVRRAAATVANFHLRDDYSLTLGRDRPRPSFIHFVNGGVGQKGWRHWDEVEALLATGPRPADHPSHSRLEP